jgi:hypothetical protein
MMECRSGMSTSVSTLILKPFCLRLLVILQQHVTCQDRARKYVTDVHIVSEKHTHNI